MMQLNTYTAQDFLSALRALLPPGEAWQWPAGGQGDAVLLATSQELVRVNAQVQGVLDRAIELHKPKSKSWRLIDYKNVAVLSQAGVVEPTRKAFVAGSKAGARLWKNPPATFAVPLLDVSVAKPFTAGSAAGSRCWSGRARFILVVRYYKTVVNVQALLDALNAFKQAHVYLCLMDITGNGGEVLSV